jgi:glycosyltransferase involved in cell wall biosynthesis
LGDAQTEVESLGSGEQHFAMGGNRWRFGRIVTQLLLCKNWDLVILGHVHLASLLLAIRGRRHVPVLVMAYGVDVWQPLSTWRKRGLQRATRVLYISEHTRQRAFAANPWLSNKPNVVCHLGLLTHGAEPEGTQAPSSAPFALAIGRMEREESYKGFQELIEVWPAVTQRLPELELVLIGDGNDRARLQAHANLLQAKVRFLGSVDDGTRDAYLRRCTCFCLPSRGEGFGLVYLEAMCAGKAVLAGNGDAGREVVLDGVTGKTVDPQDQTDLVEGIVAVRNHALDWGSNGRQRYLDEFTFDRFRRRFADVIDATLQVRSTT